MDLPRTVESVLSTLLLDRGKNNCENNTVSGPNLSTQQVDDAGEFLESMDSGDSSAKKRFARYLSLRTTDLASTTALDDNWHGKNLVEPRDIGLYASTLGFVFFPLLPPELRNLVYRFALKSVPNVGPSKDQFGYCIKDSHLPNLCKAIPEAIPTYIETTTFAVGTFDGPTAKHWDIPTFQYFLKSHQGGFECVRSLDIADLGPGFATSEDARAKRNIDLVKRCPGLKFLTLTVEKPNNPFSAPPWSGLKPLDEEEIRRLAHLHGLESLFECKKLRQIFYKHETMRRRDHTSFFYFPSWEVHNANLKRTRDVMKWVQEEFKRRNNRTVEVREAPGTIPMRSYRI